MTDTIQPTATIPDREDWQKQTRERDRLAGEVLDENKTALFGALSQAAIATVTVRFDGWYGDTGQIEEIEAQAAGTAVPLPEGTIDIASPLWDGSGVPTGTSDDSGSHRAACLRFSRTDPWRLGKQRGCVRPIPLRRRGPHDHARIQ